MLYLVFKFLHVLGIILLIGNVSVTSVWKVFADRTRCPATVAHAQRLVTATDWAFTGSGIVLTMVGGYGMAISAGIDLINIPWLLWSQVLFAASGCIWLFVLVPIQTAQSRYAAGFVGSEAIPEAYWRLSRRWLFWGVVATVPLIGALFLMVAKI